jgi:hypothetical protein
MGTGGKTQIDEALINAENRLSHQLTDELTDGVN